MKTFISCAGILVMLFLYSCNNTADQHTVTQNSTIVDSSSTKTDTGNKKIVIERKKADSISYHLDTMKHWLTAAGKGIDSIQERIVIAVNRTDKAGLRNMKTIIVPSDLNADIAYYLPFPLSVPFLKDIHKILFFSYPAQAFAAYENGELVYTGQTNMGRKKDPTPTGLYYTNWKAEETKSTFNDEWDLKWNFNIENKEGIGFHQYALPGYPASHSCLRLTETDAKYLYSWADQWILKGTDNIIANGTPLIVFGTYNFGGPKPWLQLVSNPHAMDISADTLQALAQPHLDEILMQQRKRTQAEPANANK
ncbi:MAG: L,D-transpeptidase [Ferruginibacter sp.]